MSEDNRAQLTKRALPRASVEAKLAAPDDTVEIMLVAAFRP
jgi:hypothetical protein